MKFQNPSFKFFLNGQTDKQTDKPKAICSPLFQSWGHKNIFFQIVCKVELLLLKQYFSFNG